MGESRDARGWAAAPATALLPWDPREIAGYRLLGRLGSGGMGTVYLSTTRGGQSVAVKVVHPHLAGEPRFRQRFRQEVRAARRVRGRFLAAVVDSNTDGAVPWLATEYVRGPSLSQALGTNGGALAPRTVLRLVAGVASALADMHEAGVIHRDLTPGNVLLAGDGPVVIDFGIAHAADATSLTGTRTRVGTPGFMAPEQAVGGTITPAADLFALGLTAFVAATNQHPFGEGSADVLLYRVAHGAAELDACPAELRALLEPCLRREPADRPSAVELLASCRETAAEWGMDGALPTTGWVPIVAPAPGPSARTQDATTVTGMTPPQHPPPPHPREPTALDQARAGEAGDTGAAAVRRDRRSWRGAALMAALAVGVVAGVVVASVTNGANSDDAADHAGPEAPEGEVGGASPDEDGGTPDGGGNDDGPEDETPEPETEEEPPDEEAADETPEPGDTEPDEPDTAGVIPDFYLGTWTARPVWDGVEHVRTMTVRQASPGEVAMVLTATMPAEFGEHDEPSDFPGVDNAYHCQFQAELATVHDGTVELRATEVIVRKGECLPGDPTVLVRDGEQLRRDNTNELAPLTYTRVR